MMKKALLYIIGIAAAMTSCVSYEAEDFTGHTYTVLTLKYMSYIRETFYCINDSTKNIHLRWQNKYYVYAYTVIFMLHNLKKRACQNSQYK